MTTIHPLLAVHDLQVVFSTGHGEVRAVDKISFTVMPGETVAVVGESGSGKSVTALSLLQLVPSPVGRVSGGTAVFQSPVLGSFDLLALPQRQLQQVRGNDIAMVFQEPGSSLNPVLTCGDQVSETLMVHRKAFGQEARDRTLTLFEMVRLPQPKQIFHAYPHELSGGQKQRVMIAMAMACQPALLLADEPTTSLDVTVQARVLELLDELRVLNNMAMLFISHDLGVVAEIADRVLVMYQGKIVEHGPVETIFSNPQHPYTKGLLACRPSLSFGRRRLPTVADFMRNGAEIGVKGPVDIVPVANSSLSTEKKSPKSLVDLDPSYPQQEKPGAPLWEVDNLQVHFPIRKGWFARTTEYVRAVDGVSFQVFPGETVALVGESGSGKTTLGRALLRLEEPTAGKILFEGNDLGMLSPNALRTRRKEFQIIFQDPYSSLNPLMTVGEAIVEPMRAHRILPTESARQERARELLHTVNLEPAHFYRFPHEFSGGQRQRISIARALSLQPKFLVCDECVSALDVSVQAQVLNLLNQLKEDFGITYLFITHDLSVARYMADRIFVMHQGKMVESGDARTIYEQPQHPYTKALLSAIPHGSPEDIQAARKKREESRAEMRKSVS